MHKRSLKIGCVLILGATSSTGCAGQVADYVGDPAVSSGGSSSGGADVIGDPVGLPYGGTGGFVGTAPTGGYGGSVGTGGWGGNIGSGGAWQVGTGGYFIGDEQVGAGAGPGGASGED